MTDKQLIREALYRQRTTQAALADMLGYRRPGNVTTLLSASGGASIRTSTFFQMLDALGYDIVVVDRKNGETLGKLDFPKKEQATPEESAKQSAEEIQSARENWKKEIKEKERIENEWLQEIVEMYPTQGDVLKRVETVIKTRAAGEMPETQAAAEIDILKKALKKIQQENRD